MSHPDRVDGPDPLRILLVADYFGRDRATGTKRANAFAKHWGREPGVEVVALTCHKRHVALNDAETARFGPHVREVRVWWPDIIGFYTRVARRLRVAPGPSPATASTAAGVEAPDTPPSAGGTPIWKRPLKYLSDLLVVPDRHALWALTGTPRGVLLDRPDVVVATAPAFVNLLIGRRLAAFHKVPLVADFRDPWLTNPFRPQFEGRLKRRDERLERSCVAAADEVWVTTDSVRTLYASHPAIRAPECVRVIPNGYDEEEFEGMRRQRGADDRLRIVHTGSLYGVRTPVPFLEDLVAVAPRLDPKFVARLDVRFIGPADPDLVAQAHAILADSPLAERVSFLPPVTGREALQAQLDADIGLLIGHRSADGSTQIPMKLYEYFRAGNPILAYFDGDSEVANVARRDSGLGVRLADLADPAKRRAALDGLLRDCIDGAPGPQPDAIRRYERAQLAHRALDRLRALTSARSAAP